MNSIRNIIVATTLSAVLSVAHLAAAQAADDVKMLKPLQGISFHAATKHAVAYFLRDNGSCKLVVTATDDANFVPTRSEAAIGAGNSTQYELAEGKSLEFVCQTEAQTMSVRSLEAIADETPNILPVGNRTQAGLGG